MMKTKSMNSSIRSLRITKQLIRENKELKNRLQALEEKLGHFTNIEETLSKTIIVAQEAADELKNNSKKEAQLIIREAEKNADRIINEALAKSRKIALEMEELKKQATIYRTRFRRFSKRSSICSVKKLGFSGKRSKEE